MAEEKKQSQYPSEMMKVAGLGSKSDYDLTLIP